MRIIGAAELRKETIGGASMPSSARRDLTDAAISVRKGRAKRRNALGANSPPLDSKTWRSCRHSHSLVSSCWFYTIKANLRTCLHLPYKIIY